MAGEGWKLPGEVAVPGSRAVAVASLPGKRPRRCPTLEGSPVHPGHRSDRSTLMSPQDDRSTRLDALRAAARRLEGTAPGARFGLFLVGGLLALASVWDRSGLQPS